MLRICSLLPGISLICCTSGGQPSRGDAGSGEPSDGGASHDGATESCSPGERSCNGTGHQRQCLEVNGIPTWTESACDEYSYCLEDRCLAACLDECPLGAARASSDGAQTCRLYSADSEQIITPTSGSHDLARRHLAWTRAHQLANGYIANTLFSTNSHTTPIAYTGTVDAAEWTGVYLAAESLRALETHSPDAIANVEAIVERVFQLFDVTGTPGYMARIWAPLDGDPLLADLYDAGDWSHFAVDYGGGPAFYHGWTSRDMYAGVSVGLGLAYDATSSPVHRAMIRDVVIGLARELIRDRTAVPVRIRYNLFSSWQETDLTFDMQHVVLVPDEMVDGRVFIQIGSDAEPSNYDVSEMVGAREFLPDFQTVLGQTPGLGPLLPSIPRPSTAMMMASFMELALHVTDGVPGSETDHQMVRVHYDANKATWLDIMRQYAYHNQQDCWKQYFGMTIAYHAIYSLLRLTDDDAYHAAIHSDVLATRMRPFVEGHANAYFDYIAAAYGPAGLVPADELAATGAQLAGFIPPPKAAVAVDNTGSYPASAECAGQSSVPVAIGDRVPRDFMWQHHPFRLVNEQVDEKHVYPTTDYLIAYWMGRYHGYIADDAPDTCTRWITD